MADDSDWLKLSTEEKLQHSSWKARQAAYDDLKKIFEQQTDEKSAEFTKYGGHLKKAVVDANAVAQDHALFAVEAFLRSAAVQIAARFIPELCTPIVQKGVGSSRNSTKEKAFELLLIVIELEKGEMAFEAVFEALQTKQPKLLVGSLQFLRIAIQQFGIPVCPAKPIIKDAVRLIEDRDKTVREECKALLIDVARFIGVVALKPQMASMNEIVQKQLESELSAITERATPSRFLRSQQARSAASAAGGGASVAGAAPKSGSGSAASKVAEVDPFSLLEAADVLKSVPADFFEKVEAKKWQERKEALESVEKVVKSAQKLADGDYGALIAALNRSVQKDVNVMCAGVAVQCLTYLARGLRSKFAPFARELLLDCLLEKLKERKLASQLRDCLDACFAATAYQLDPVGETLIKELENKSPTVKSEVALFLGRSFAKMSTATLPKKWLKPFCAALTRTANDGDPMVRESSFEALGAAMKCVGERNIAPFLSEMDETRSKKVRECFEKLSGEQKSESEKAEKADKLEPLPADNKTADASPKGAGLLSSLKPAGGAQKRPTTAPPRSETAAPASASQSKTTKAPAKATAPAKTAKKGDSDLLHSEPELSESEVDVLCTPLLTADTITQLGDADRKVRIAAVESVQSRVKQLVLAAADDPSRLPTQALVKLIIRKPGLRDTNFQIVKAKLETLRCILDSEASRLTQSTASLFLIDTTACLSDAKYADAARSILIAAAEHCSLEFVSREVLGFAFVNEATKEKDAKESSAQKGPIASPKVQEAVLLLMATALRDFGLQAPLKVLMDALRIAIQSSNAAVRAAAFSLTGVVGAYAGAARIRAQFEADQKPAVLAQLDAEFEKQKDAASSPPTRFLRGKKRMAAAAAESGAAATESADTNTNTNANANAAEEDDELDAEPVDVLRSVPSDFEEKVQAKKWQERKEVLENLEKTLKSAPKLADGDYADLVGILCKCAQKDVNMMCVGVAVQCLTQLARGLRQRFSPFAREILTETVSERLKERKLSAQLRELLDAALAALNFSLDSVAEDLLAQVDGAKSPTVKQELALLFARLFAQPRFLPNKCLPKGGFYKTLVASLVKLANDGDPQVREAAFEALGAALRGVGERTTNPLIAELDEAKSKKVRECFEKLGGPKAQPQASAPAPAPAPAAAASFTKTDKLDKSDLKKTAKPGSSESLLEPKRPQTAPAKSTGSKKERPGAAETSQSSSKGGKDDKKDDSALLDSAIAAKEQRVREEFGANRRPGAQGNFGPKGGPRWDVVLAMQHATKEHQEALRAQLEPHANRDLIDGLLNFTDFKLQLKALDLLVRFVAPDTVQCFIANLDLISKTLILLNYENNNTTLLLKSIELLQAVMGSLVALRPRYALVEYEAQLLVPLLLVKLHDSSNNQIAKDKLKALMVRELTLLYPASRVFAFVLDNIGKREFKNAKFRIDCVELLHALVELFGFAMCAVTQSGGALQPAAMATLKQICFLLSEQRDTTLRVALVQLLVLINAHIGDAEFARHVFPLLAEKDAQMFEDRKARARRPGAAPQLSALAQTASSAHMAASAVPVAAPSLPHSAHTPTAANVSIGSASFNASVNASSVTPSAATPQSAARRPSSTLSGRPATALPVASDESAADGSKRFCFSSEWDVEPFDSDLPKLVEVDLAPIFAPFELPRIVSTRIGAFGERMSGAQLNALLGELSSSRVEDSVGALLRLKEVLDDPNIADRVLVDDCEALNRITACIAQQLATVLVRYVDDTHSQTVDPAQTRLVKLLLGNVTNVIDYPRNEPASTGRQFLLLKQLNADVLHRLCASLCTMLSDDRVHAQFEKSAASSAISNQNDLENAGRSAQTILGRLMEHASCTAMLVALGRLVADSARALMLATGGPVTSERYFDVVTRCATRFLKRLNSSKADKSNSGWSPEDLCLEEVFSDLDRFLRECPTATWKSKAVSATPVSNGANSNANKPFRLLRTIVYQLVTLRGADTLHVAQLVLTSSGGSQKDSELLALLNKSLKKAIKSNQLGGEAGGATSLREQLAQIFVRIGVKETSQEGLVELYRFRKRHPQIDVNAFLEKAGENFQKFVTVSLRNIELDEELKRSRATVRELGNGNGLNGNGEAGVEETDVAVEPIPDEIFSQPEAIKPFFSKRLEMLTSRFADDNGNGDAARSGSPQNDLAGDSALMELSNAPQLEVERPTVTITARPAAVRNDQADLLAIQRRLAELRAGKK